MSEPATNRQLYVQALGVDFDGVLHNRTNTGSVPDGDPLPGALDAVRQLMATYAVFIHTTRRPDLVVNWLARHGLPAIVDDQEGRQFWSEQGTLLVTRQKIVAVAYIDDRAIRFESWPQALAEVARLY
ncbi:hypothetical protein ACWDFH_12395 [Streptomyces kronopolitis]